MAIARQPEEEGFFSPPTRDHLKVVPPTKEEAVEANAGEYAPGKVRNFLEKLSRNWAVRLGLVSGAAYGAYEYIPAVHQGVDQTYHETMKSLVSETVPPTVFDNKRDYGKITPINSLAVPLEEIKQATRVEKGKAIHISSIFDRSGTGDITYIKGLPNVGLDSSTYEKYKKEGIKNTIAFTDIPIGTTVFAPFNGKIPPINAKQTSTYLGLNLVFQDEEGKWYSLLFTGARDVKMIAQIPKVDPNSRSDDPALWTDIQVGDPLFSIESTELIQSPYVGGFASSSQLRIEAQYGPNGFGKDPWLPINISFLTKEAKILSPSVQ